MNEERGTERDYEAFLPEEEAAAAAVAAIEARSWVCLDRPQAVKHRTRTHA